MEDNRPRSHSVMQGRSTGFQVRASRFLKKVTNLRVRGSRTLANKEDYRSSEGRSSSSMDMPQMPFTTNSTSVPHHVQDSQFETEYSPRSASHDSCRTLKRISSPREVHQADVNDSSRFLRPPQPATKQRPIPDGWRQSGEDTGLSSATSHGSGAVNSQPIVDKPRPPPLRRHERHSFDPAYTRVTKEHSTERLSSIQGKYKNVGPTASTDGTMTTLTSKTPTLMSFASSAPPTSHQSVPLFFNMPPPSLNRVGSSRLTPSLVMRHPPMPILNLPTLPPPSPSPLVRMASRARLRSMPALPVAGPGDHEVEADHENSGLGDSDEEDIGDLESNSHASTGRSRDGDGDGDIRQSYESSPSSTRSPSPYLRGPPVLPAVDTSRLDLSFLDRPYEANVGKPRGRTIDDTPMPNQPVDYFSAQPNERERPSLSPARTLRPSDVQHFPFLSTSSPRKNINVPGDGLSPPPSRASVYRLPSKSMVVLVPTPKKEATPPVSLAHEGENPTDVILGKGKARESPVTATSQLPESRSTDLPAKKVEASSPTVRKLRSMPTFNPSSEPPPYPTFALRPAPIRPVVLPREEEGKEQLPPYTNSIHLVAILPRKMEFIAPGVQAKDRKWRRVLCVLEGTAFKVYQCPRAQAGVGLLEDWWEKRVGVGDVSAPFNPGKQTSVDRGVPRSMKVDLTADPNSAWLLRPPNTTSSNPSGLLQHGIRQAASTDNGSSTHSRHHSPSSSAASLVPSNRIPPSSHSPFSSSSQSIDSSALEPSKNNLIRAYTMQHAESGLGNDYLKRKNVIRLRLEGEQFLLQAVDVSAVIEWIEAFQAATNIALDLDVRPMPKGPMFPRRRRRRTRPPPANVT